MVIKWPFGKICYGLLKYQKLLGSSLTFPAFSALLELMNYASIQRIKSVVAHPNADKLDIAQVKGFKAIVPRGQWKEGDLCIYIMPDTVLPDVPWAAIYKAKSGRVKAIKLRGSWSEGIIESFDKVGYTGPVEEGLDISEVLGVIKYDPPLPQDLAAKGLLPFGIPKTDEVRAEALDDEIPFGALVDVTLKIDGQSCSFYWNLNENNEVQTGVLGRTMEYRTNAFNNYTQNQANLDALNKLSYFCRKHNLRGLCVRGESYGRGIQKGGHNPHAQLPLNWAMFSTFLIHERAYAHKGDPLYFLNIADELRLPTVPVLERDVILTPELIQKYAQMETLNGQFFEGVVVQGAFGSFKILSKIYDSKK